MQCTYEKQKVANDKLKFNKRSISTSVEKSRVFSFSKPQPIDPPKLSRISLLYSQEEVWIRLQIREFVFRFGDYFEIDTRAATSLQNVQGNWRVKRLAVNLTYRLLTHMEQGMIDVTLPPPSLSSSTTLRDSFLHGARTPQQIASRVIHRWMDHYGLTKNRYLEKEAARVAFVENLERDGLSVDNWADLIELLALLNGKPLPNNNNSDDDDDENDNQLPEPEQVVHSLFEELKMLQMVCDMLLMHNSLRRIWVHEDQPAKELRATEAEIKAERRRLDSQQQQQQREEEGKSKITNNNTSNKDKAERLQIEKKYIDVMSAQQRNNKRFGPVGRDSKGNEYWIFNDLVTYGNDARNSEPYWGHGVIIIGPGLSSGSSSLSSDNASSSTPEQGQEQCWWYLKDVDDLNQLRRWIVQDRSSAAASSSSPLHSATTTTNINNNAADSLVHQLTLRTQYLRSLQWISQVQGSSSSINDSNSNRRSTRA
ncbi:hypothetical protein BDB00DRAFT_827421 [Zychaea mexicana]|uniref:uncharacterized protein n=1 Tax=Zychaea mexicana TaxID=64656 RepID=UPI0022FDEE2D|nr:uncharacterized protein BDB00DRAFT_827421 [Zychaea mexicana]KAI9492624.1 hypothetical protein BDB00DRAFT_827421 [Zychaea mexicana]